MAEQICPTCHQMISDEDALSCHFCGNSLNRSSSGVMGMMVTGPGKWLGLLMMAAVVFVLIIFFFR